MYVQATFFPFPDQELDGPDPSDSPGCPVPVPSDPHGKAEFLATVAPLVTRIARSQHYRHGGRGGAAALEDLQADAMGLAWLRWLRSRYRPRYAVLSALCGGSVCGRARGRSVDGRGGWKQGIRRTDLHDCHHPASDPIPALERRLDV